MWLKWGVPHKLTWFPVGGNVWEGCGTVRKYCCARENRPLEQFWNFIAWPYSLFRSASPLRIKYDQPASCQSRLMLLHPRLPHHDGMIIAILSETLNQNVPFHPEVAFCHGIQYNNIKITNALAKMLGWKETSWFSVLHLSDHKGKGPTLPNKAFPD